MRDLAARKAALRRPARAKRQALHAAAGDTAGVALCAVFTGTPVLVELTGRGRLFSGYWPFGSEIDPRPLMEHLHGAGMTGALPVTAGPDAPLAFRRWRPGQTLGTGPYGIQVPAATEPPVAPDLLLVPLLAFDMAGGRLGYGAGYYDRTLRALRRRRRIVAIGLAFAGQQAEKLPAGPADEALNWVVTDRSCIEVG